MNINGTILTDEMLEQIRGFEQDDAARCYCNNLSILKDLLIKQLGDIEIDMQKQIEILTDVVYLHDFMKLFIIEKEEAV